MNNRGKLLGEEKIAKLLITFSIPAIIGMLVNALYNVVDRIFIGNAADIGPLGIAGITMTMPIMTFMLAIGLLIGVGGSAMTAIRLGEKKIDEAERILGNSFITIIIISVFFSAIGLLFAEPILKLFGTSPAIMPYAKGYLSIILIGSPFSALGLCLNNFIRVDGRPKTAMMTMIIGALLNTVLDPLFIYVFHMGIEGAAFATIISQFVSMTWTLQYFATGKSHLKFHRKNLTLHLPLVLSIMALGAPNFLMQVANTFVNILLNIRLSALGGDVAISGIGIISSLQMLLIMPILGINQGAQPIIGFNFGAKQPKRVKETLKLAIIAGTAVAITGFLLSQAFPEALISLFSKDAALLDFTVDALRVMILMIPLVGFQIISSSYFQATGRPKVATLLTLSRQVIILIPSILILSALFGVNGVIAATPVADFFAFALTGVLFWRDMKKYDSVSMDTSIVS